MIRNSRYDTFHECIYKMYIRQNPRPFRELTFKEKSLKHIYFGLGLLWSFAGIYSVNGNKTENYINNEEVILLIED
jgi:hypothetical protein